MQQTMLVPRRINKNTDTQTAEQCGSPKYHVIQLTIGLTNSSNSVPAFELKGAKNLSKKSTYTIFQPSKIVHTYV